MTIDQTRQLGIEFERRIQAVMPQEELLAKLDTDTIYAYLNEYQMKYVHDIYRNLDKLEPETQLTSHVESILQSMMASVTLSEDIADIYSVDADGWNSFIKDAGRSKTYMLPYNYYMYIRSVSQVNKTFSWQSSGVQGDDIIPNIYAKQTDVWKLLETPHNKLRILRYPAVLLDEKTQELQSSSFKIADEQARSKGSVCKLDINTSGEYDFIAGVFNINASYIGSNLKYNAVVLKRDIPAGGFSQLALDEEIDPSDTEAYIQLAKSCFSLTHIDVNQTKINTITVIHDRYTDITGVKVLYYKQPQYFDIMTSTPCELPMDAFNDLVEGAVALYLNYYRGGIRQQEEEGRRDRFNRRQAERENENQNNEQQ